MLDDDVLVYVSLPLEICELIISSQDLASAACCRVCKAWYPRARYHLYTTTLIRVYKISTFALCLDLNRANGALVKYLHIFGIRQLSEKDHELSLLPILLPHRLPNLTSLTFEMVSFRALNPSFFTYMRRFYTVISMTWIAVEFGSIYQPVRLVRSIPHLEQLQILHPSLYRPPSTDVCVGRLRHSISISRLDLSLLGSALPDSFIEVFSPTQLAELLVPCGPVDGYITNFKYLKQCSQTLQYLELSFCSGHRDHFLGTCASINSQLATH